MRAGFTPDGRAATVAAKSSLGWLPAGEVDAENRIANRSIHPTTDPRASRAGDRSGHDLI